MISPKFFYFSYFFLIFINVNAQVGINTNDPKVTLDVVGSPNINSAMDGILPPRITGDQLKSKFYTSSQNGAIIYVTTPVSVPSEQTSNVLSEGLYIFNSFQNKWVALTSFQRTNVFCNDNDPNNATIFDVKLPAVNNDNSLKEDFQKTYYGQDGSVWLWSGMNYITYQINNNLNVGERVSVYKSMLNTVPNNTILSSGLIELDSLIRIDIRKVDNTFFSPRLRNISGNNIRITYYTTSSNAEQSINLNLFSNAAIEVDGDNALRWQNTSSETCITNLILPNGKWYEIEWFGFEVNSTKHIYMSALRKF